MRMDMHYGIVFLRHDTMLALLPCYLSTYHDCMFYEGTFKTSRPF